MPGDFPVDIEPAAAPLAERRRWMRPQVVLPPAREGPSGALRGAQMHAGGPINDGVGRGAEDAGTPTATSNAVARDARPRSW